MPAPTITIFSVTMPTYTFLVGLGILISGGYALLNTPSDQRGKTADVLLIGLVGALIVGRIEHLILNWGHFSFHTDEIIQLRAGGIDWHGALVGVGIGLWIGSRWRKITVYPIVNRLVLAIPLIGLMAWWGCGANSCAYGTEIETLSAYPSWLVWEGRDIFGLFAPRFRTQFIGLLLYGGLLLLTLLLLWRGWLLRGRLSLILLLFSLIMFALGFLRGDFAVYWYGLRIDQWLDLVVAGISIVGFWFEKSKDNAIVQ